MKILSIFSPKGYHYPDFECHWDEDGTTNFISADPELQSHDPVKRKPSVYLIELNYKIFLFLDHASLKTSDSTVLFP